MQELKVGEQRHASPWNSTVELHRGTPPPWKSTVKLHFSLSLMLHVPLWNSVSCFSLTQSRRLPDCFPQTIFLSSSDSGCLRPSGAMVLSQKHSGVLALA